MTNWKNFHADLRALASKVSTNGENVWRANSPKEALAWLRLHIYYPATVAISSEEKNGPKMIDRAFFRGHAVSDWKPVPTLLREDAVNACKAELASSLAAAVIHQEFELLLSSSWTQAWPGLSENSGYAAAQHYGIKTSLLDWTGNPEVAVHFATCSKSSKNSSEASVLWLPASSALDMDLKVVLPPIHIVRLYLQRGLFVKLDRNDIDKLETKCGKIVFPAQPRQPALLTTDGKEFVENELVPPEPWFDALNEWSAQHANNDKLQANHNAAYQAFTSKHGHHPALKQISEVEALAHAPDKAIYSFIASLARRETRSGHCFDPRLLELIDQGNPCLLRWLTDRGYSFPRCF